MDNEKMIKSLVCLTTIMSERIEDLTAKIEVLEKIVAEIEKRT